MENHIAILYSDSQFTPWKENIDSKTVKNILENIPSLYKTTIVHMTEPNDALASFLKNFQFVINVCYGYLNYSQSDIANWLDWHNIPHLSSSGKTQSLVQDKTLTENALIKLHLPTAKSLEKRLEITESKFDYFIVKPIKGGCHRGIYTYTKSQLLEAFNSMDLSSNLIQPYLTGREFSVAIIPSENGKNYKALHPVEIVPFPQRKVYIAGQQYGQTKKDFFPDLTIKQTQKLQNIATDAHVQLGLKYFSRIDFRLHDNDFLILDVNAMPNLHPQLSVLPAILCSMNIPFKSFVERIIKCHDNEIHFQKINVAKSIETSELTEAI